MNDLGAPERDPKTGALYQIVPSDLGTDVARRVMDHISTLGFRLCPSMEIVMPQVSSPAGTTLAWTVVHLTQYAQTGALGDWSHTGNVSDAMLDVFAALYTSAGDPDLGTGDIDKEADPEKPIGLVLVAALARVRLSQRGGTVTARELSVLAGLGAAQIRALGRAGELRIENGNIARADAWRFLAARGVPGFRPKTSRDRTA